MKIKAKRLIFPECCFPGTIPDIISWDMYNLFIHHMRWLMNQGDGNVSSLAFWWQPPGEEQGTYRSVAPPPTNMVHCFSSDSNETRAHGPQGPVTMSSFFLFSKSTTSKRGRCSHSLHFILYFHVFSPNHSQVALNPCHPIRKSCMCVSEPLVSRRVCHP